MSLIISILLYLGCLIPGTYSHQELDAIIAANIGATTPVMADPVLVQHIGATVNPSIVTIYNDNERD